MATLFTKIIQGEIPSYKIAEDENYYAFLDIFPLKLGHTLVIPKQEIDYFYDMDDATMAGLHLFAKKIALAIRKVTKCERVCEMVIGFEIPHAHLHLIPADNMADLDFSKKGKASEEDLKAIAEKIRQAL